MVLSFNVFIRTEHEFADKLSIDNIINDLARIKATRKDSKRFYKTTVYYAYNCLDVNRTRLVMY